MGNTFLRLKFKSEDLYNYQKTIDIKRDDNISMLLEDLAQEHFLSDKRFNLPEQNVYNVNVFFYRYNDKEYQYLINYSVGLGLYENHQYQGNVDVISQSFHAPQNIIDWFVELEKKED